MMDQDPKLDLANLMLRKVGLIRSIRHELQKKGPKYFDDLTEIIEAVERIKAEEAANR